METSRPLNERQEYATVKPLNNANVHVSINSVMKNQTGHLYAVYKATKKVSHTSTRQSSSQLRVMRKT